MQVFTMSRMDKQKIAVLYFEKPPCDEHPRELRVDSGSRGVAATMDFLKLHDVGPLLGDPILNSGLRIIAEFADP